MVVYQRVKHQTSGGMTGRLRGSGNNLKHFVFNLVMKELDKNPLRCTFNPIEKSFESKIINHHPRGLGQNIKMIEHTYYLHLLTTN